MWDIWGIVGQLARQAIYGAIIHINKNGEMYSMIGLYIPNDIPQKIAITGENHILL